MTIVGGAAIDKPKELTVSLSLWSATLGLTLVVALTLRLWNIASVPPELHPDEYAGWLGINAMLSGGSSPTVFLDYGVVYLPLYGLLETISGWLFGPTVTAFRLPAALLGVVTALGTGLLGYQLVRSRAILLLGCAMMAILPWDVSASRIAWEPAAMLPCLLFGLYLLRRGLYASSGRDASIGFALLAIGAYSYRAESFYAVTLGTALLAIEFERARAMWREVLIGLGIAALIMLPLGVSVLVHPQYLTSGPAQGTFDVGINPASLAEFGNLYFKHFSIQALFFTGDGNMQHGPPTGVLYPWMAPFILGGLLAPLGLFPLRARLFALVWLGLYPFGGSLTDENGGQQFIRTIAGAPLFCILAAIGLLACWQIVTDFAARTRWRVTIVTATTTLLAAVALGQLVQFCDAYFVRYPDQAAKAFHYGDRDIFAFVRTYDAGYDRVCFTVLDGWNWTAQVLYYMHDYDTRGSTLDVIPEFDKSCKKPKSLLALQSQLEAPPDARFLGTVQRRDGTIRAYFYAIP
jgi:4-amino-4-deoxy-L-arabinose transferase-like glycosyltransferase